MIRGKCPTCGKAYEAPKFDDLKSFPFCSDRCRLVDLGRWIDGVYAIPERAQPESPEAEVESEDDED